MDARPAIATGTIRLHGLASAPEISREQVYFAFASGRFGYDCLACGAKCCRGYGYRLGSPGATDAQLTLRPAVRFFMEPSGRSGGVQLQTKNCPPGCFFLDAGNLCGIQRNSGYDAKPETCRLFPFNNMSLVGEHLVVAPHPGLCPLEVREGGRTSTDSDHDALFAAMRAHGIEAPVSTAVPSGLDAATLVELERHIVRTSEAFLEATDYLPFVAAQCAATRAALQRQASVSSNGATRDTVPDEDLAAVLQYRALMARVLGVPDLGGAASESGQVRTLVAATPYVRSQLVFRDPKGEGLARAVSLERVPWMLLGLHALSVLAREAGMEQVSYQTIVRLLSDQRPLLTLLSHLDTPVIWRTGQMIDLQFEAPRDWRLRYLRIARELARSPRAASVPLGTLLLDVLPTEDLERAVFLKMLAQRLAGAAVPAAAIGGQGSSYRLRPALQRWAIRAVDAEALATFAERRTGALR
ncbi:MAG: YkgJ family cysteine cluster protein [Gemmatimonadaceae bacterium]|nr:YkgJ family cysteine cluster protein [Gemmatimonadaceae bacterium]MCW5827329.1 YkgJ family cysteine cluster protein [Gemmatimonadaceae bacterium]